MTHILLAGDEQAIADNIMLYLRHDGYTVSHQKCAHFPLHRSITGINVFVIWVKHDKYCQYIFTAHLRNAYLSYTSLE